jgi:hypothetical protein
MRILYPFLASFFAIGLVLFSLGQFLTLTGGDSRLGFELSICGIAFWAVLLIIGMLYVARVRFKILKDASRF